MRLKADLHIHTVLSPCGSLWMSPAIIVQRALEEGLQVIGITDHNSCLNAAIIQSMAQSHGIFVMTGAEVCTAEDVHCLCFMKDLHQLDVFQKYLETHYTTVQNNTQRFGEQLVVDENENIIAEVPQLLLAATNISINALRSKVRELGGLFIPAHVNRSSYSISSQLGFMPPDLYPDAIEISRQISIQQFSENPGSFGKLPIIQSSDAHNPEDIGRAYIFINTKNLCFESIAEAIRTNKIISM